MPAPAPWMKRRLLDTCSVWTYADVVDRSSQQLPLFARASEPEYVPELAPPLDGEPYRGWSGRVRVRVDAQAAIARGRPVVLGAAGEPYPAVERHFRVTRRLLERLRALPPTELTIVTRGDLVRRDAPLLGELARRHRVTVAVAIDPAEPAAATAARLRAVAALAEHGVRAGVRLAPVAPETSDRALAAAVARARAAGARFLEAERIADPLLAARVQRAVATGDPGAPPLRAAG